MTKIAPIRARSGTERRTRSKNCVPDSSPIRLQTLMVGRPLETRGTRKNEPRNAPSSKRSRDVAFRRRLLRVACQAVAAVSFLLSDNFAPSSYVVITCTWRGADMLRFLPRSGSLGRRLSGRDVVATPRWLVWRLVPASSSLFWSAIRSFEAGVGLCES